VSSILTRALWHCRVAMTIQRCAGPSTWAWISPYQFGRWWWISTIVASYPRGLDGSERAIDEKSLL
jgi:hypothetical protein